MLVSATPPHDWDARVVSPVLSRGFAEAMATVGWRPLFAADDSDAALILVRRLPLPGLRGWTARARVYPNLGYPTFVRGLHRWLADEGIGVAVLGDAVWPLPPHLQRESFQRMRLQGHHRIVHDVQRDDAALLAAMDAKNRWNVRKSLRDGVVVSEIATEAELEEYCLLASETSARIRDRQLIAALPDPFYRSIFRTLVPRGQGLFLLARADGRALAGALFLRSADALTYYFGASTRDPALTPRQGPCAVVWHAMRLARAQGIRYFDHGAVTVTEDREHPHFSVYDFKRRFGGRLEPIASAELVLSRAKHAFQERVLMPAWKRLHPLYVRLAGAAASAAGWVLALGV
jgi:hypothetical protein